ncbi:MAG: D-alanyl-D-alanine carboxypeptidase, partial [Pseudomonadota bacterium]
AAQNLRLPDLRRAKTMPAGLTVVAEVRSAASRPMLHAMMKYSTNLTAEVMGLRAHQAFGGTPATIAQSAAAMTAWARGRFGLGKVVFQNHSGLTDTTRITSDEMVQLLDHATQGPLSDLMKPVVVLDRNGNRAETGGTKVVAKTGTLNFTRALAGYVEAPNGRRMAFAIFAADLAARAGLSSATEVPRGSRRFRNVARRQEQALLRRWIQLYGRA